MQDVERLRHISKICRAEGETTDDWLNGVANATVSEIGGDDARRAITAALTDSARALSRRAPSETRQLRRPPRPSRRQAGRPETAAGEAEGRLRATSRRQPAARPPRWPGPSRS